MHLCSQRDSGGNQRPKRGWTCENLLDSRPNLDSLCPTQESQRRILLHLVALLCKCPHILNQSMQEDRKDDKDHNVSQYHSALILSQPNSINSGKRRRKGTRETDCDFYLSLSCLPYDVMSLLIRHISPRLFSPSSSHSLESLFRTFAW